MEPTPALAPDTIEKLRGVSTATITMVLLKRGIRRSWMQGPTPLRPLAERVVGEAHTIRFVPAREDLATPESYATEHSFRHAIEASPSGSIVVIDARGSADTATLGDILAARLRHRGVVAAVTDGPVRDAAGVAAVGLPVLSNGAAAPPSIHTLVYAGHGDVIGCGGVAVCPGDVIVGDGDGAVVIPRALADEVAEAGVEQERFERYVLARVEQGRSVVGLYPPNQDTLDDYAHWVEASKTPDV